MAEYHTKGIEQWRGCEDRFLTLHPDLSRHQPTSNLGFDAVTFVDLAPADGNGRLACAPQRLVDLPDDPDLLIAEVVELGRSRLLAQFGRQWLAGDVVDISFMPGQLPTRNNRYSTRNKNKYHKEQTQIPQRTKTIKLNKKHINS